MNNNIIITVIIIVIIIIIICILQSPQENPYLFKEIAVYTVHSEDTEVFLLGGLQWIGLYLGTIILIAVWWRGLKGRRLEQKEPFQTRTALQVRGAGGWDTLAVGTGKRHTLMVKTIMTLWFVEYQGEPWDRMRTRFSNKVYSRNARLDELLKKNTRFEWKWCIPLEYSGPEAVPFCVACSGWLEGTPTMRWGEGTALHRQTRGSAV